MAGAEEPSDRGEVANLKDINPFEVLGIRPSADAADVRAAYRRKVKDCHPDQFGSDLERQRAAQEELIQLNLAYEEALKTASQHRVGFNLISREEAMHFAQRLLEQGNPESALRQLNRADAKDESWYELNGKILMGMHRYEEAHQSFRAAVRLDPENKRFRAQALEAAVQQKNSKKLNVRLENWIKDAISKKR